MPLEVTIGLSEEETTPEEVIDAKVVAAIGQFYSKPDIPENQPEEFPRL